MEKTLKFNSQIATSLVQSERLLALGLKKETADIRGVEGIEHTMSAEIKRNANT